MGYLVRLFDWRGVGLNGLNGISPLGFATLIEVAMSGVSFDGAVIAAPMVRVSHLGFRILCASKGASVVFSEELIAAKLLRARREVVSYTFASWIPLEVRLGLTAADVVEFVVYEPFRNKWKRQVVFSTLLKTSGRPLPEGCPVVAQLGAADPVTAARAAELLCDDIDGIDVNMGCPKKFSTENGMGASLMNDPCRAASILQAINSAVNSPERIRRREGRIVHISFKTRLFDDAQQSIQQLKEIMEVAPCVRAITLHARTRAQRSETPPLLDVAEYIVKGVRQRYPSLFEDVAMVFNGSVSHRELGLAEANLRGFQGVLIARHALWDFRVFSSGRPPRDTAPGFTSKESSVEEQLRVFSEWLLYALAWKTPFMHAKYHLTRAFQEFPAAKHTVYPLFQRCQSYQECARIFGLQTHIIDAIEPERLDLLDVDPTAAAAPEQGWTPGDELPSKLHRSE